MRILAPTRAAIAEATLALREGRVVVMPTETVYGLAGAISHPRAIQSIFEAKKRPAENPLIVHVASREQVSPLVMEITPNAHRLIEAFWPGPLTIVLWKSNLVSDRITGGGPTVALRMPSHPIALDLIRQTTMPLAAPSANRFTELSPTRAQDVSPHLGIDIVLDGGACSVGLESTVVDCTEDLPRILRPGQISQTQIETIVGKMGSQKADGHRAPGQYPRHYAPVTPVRIAGRLEPDEGGLTFSPPVSPGQLQLPRDPALYAAALYESLHRLDLAGVKEIVVEAPPSGPEWEAIWDRLKRASSL